MDSRPQQTQPSNRRDYVTASARAVCAGVLLLATQMPFDSAVAGILALTMVIHSGYGLKAKSAGLTLFTVFSFSLSYVLIPTFWQIRTLHSLIGMPAAARMVVMTGYIVVVSAPVWILILGIRYMTRDREWFDFGIILFLVLLGDMSPRLFPWHWGNLLQGGDLLRQWASVAGVHGLSAVAAFLAYVAYRSAHYVLRYVRLLNHRRKGRAAGAMPKRSAVHFLIVSFSTGLALVWYGHVRQDAPPDDSSVSFRIAIIQTRTGKGLKRLRQDQAWASEAINVAFNMGLQAIRQSPFKLDALIFPESFVPFHGILDDNGNKRVYSSSLHSIVTILSLFGKTNVILNHLKQRSSSLINSIAVVGPRGYIRGEYEKQRLFPFGEYIPFEKQLPFLRKWFPEASNYVEGKRPEPLVIRRNRRQRPLEDRVFRHREEEFIYKAVRKSMSPSEIRRNWPDGEWIRNPEKGERKQWNILPSLCYEVIFPETIDRMMDAPAVSPDMLLNLANDMWFESPLEAYQHTSLGRLRAVEWGIPLIRAGLGGPSVVFDAKGNIIGGPTSVGERRILYVEIPIHRTATMYAAYGRHFFYTMLWITGFFALMGRINVNAFRDLWKRFFGK